MSELISIIVKVSTHCAIVLFIHCSNNSFSRLMTKQVSRLMKKACTLKIASQLRDLTDYAALCDNDMRWSSTDNMLKRFLNIKTELSAIVKLLTLFSNHLEVDILSRACETMKKFDSVTIMLQRNRILLVLYIRTDIPRVVEKYTVQILQ
jgi:hypothetical protein